MIDQSVQRTTRPDFSETYARYLRAIKDEEARLGRQLRIGEVEKINRKVFAPMNRAVWEG